MEQITKERIRNSKKTVFFTKSKIGEGNKQLSERDQIDHKSNDKNESGNFLNDKISSRVFGMMTSINDALNE